LDPRQVSRSYWREPFARELPTAAFVFVLGVPFPCLAHWLRWPSRLGPRGLAAYIAFKTLEGFAIRHGVVPMISRYVELHQRLVEELGREPTETELREHLLAVERERKAARRASATWTKRLRAALRATREPDG
jgi:hypothetical protein